MEFERNSQGLCVREDGKPISFDPPKDCNEFYTGKFSFDICIKIQII